MRLRILGIGALVCCGIGPFFALVLVHEMIVWLREVPFTFGAVVEVLAYYWPLLIYSLLTFAPAIILVKSHPDRNSPWHLWLAGVAEFIVVFAFIAYILSITSILN